MSAFSKGAEEGEGLSDSCAETECRQRCHTQHMSQLPAPPKLDVSAEHEQRSASVTSVTGVDVAVLLVPVGLHVQEMLNWPVEWNTKKNNKKKQEEQCLKVKHNKFDIKRKRNHLGLLERLRPFLARLPLFSLVSAVIIGLAGLF